MLVETFDVIRRERDGPDALLCFWWSCIPLATFAPLEGSLNGDSSLLLIYVLPLEPEILTWPSSQVESKIKHKAFTMVGGSFQKARNFIGIHRDRFRFRF